MAYKHAHLAVLSCVCILALAACNSAPPTESPLRSPLPSPAAVQTPSADKAAVSGVVMRADGTTPFGAVEVFFAQVTRSNGNGVYVVDTASSPWAATAADGSFRTAPMPPGEYVIVIGDPIGKNVVVVDDTGKPKVWQMNAGQVLDVGTLSVDIR